MRRFESSPSQPPSLTLLVFRAPKLAAAGVNSPIVSGGYLKYSRFWETATGDRVRSGPAWREPQSYRGRDLKKGLGASGIAKALKIWGASVYRALLSAP